MWLRQRFTPDPAHGEAAVLESWRDPRTTALLERLRAGDPVAVDGWRDVREDPSTGRLWLVTPFERDVALFEYEMCPLSPELAERLRDDPALLARLDGRGLPLDGS